jgi:hypothetical protein
MGADRNSSAATAGQTGGSRRLAASDHAKGTFVYSPDGNRLGRIERVMVDEATGEIVEAVVSFTFGHGGGMPADEHTLPWSLLAYNSRFNGYELSIVAREALRRDR